MRVSVIGVLLFPLICASFAGAAPRWVEGTYQNPALGFSIQIPRGLRGLTGDQDGPERGVRISLPSSGEIAVFGEPNSLEWKNPAAGVRDDLAQEGCSAGKPELSPTHVGQVSGAKGILFCGDRLLVVLMVFRPGGGPIYWLQLKTTRDHQSVDDAILANVAASFKLFDGSKSLLLMGTPSPNPWDLSLSCQNGFSFGAAHAAPPFPAAGRRSGRIPALPYPPPR
jgi:hypothetical protein